MIWVVHCTDAPDAAARRLTHRSEHSANLKSQPHVCLITGGPLLAEADGSAATGSLFLVEADQRDQVERFVATDPFSIQGIWAEVRINAFLPAPARHAAPIGSVPATAGAS